MDGHVGTRTVSRTSGTVRAIGVLARVEAKEAVVDGAEAPDKVVEEDGAKEKVEDAVPDHLARG